MIITIDTENVSDKTQHPVIMKTLNKQGIEKNFLKMVKAIYKNPQLTSDSMVKDWKLSPNIRDEIRMPPFVTSIQHIYGYSSHNIWEKKSHLNRKGITYLLSDKLTYLILKRLTKAVKDLYNENYRTLLKEIKEDINTQKDILGS